MENSIVLKPTKENILKLTEGGKLIFLYFMRSLKIRGSRSKNTKSPFYSDTKGSFSVFLFKGRWYFKDYGAPEFNGDAFDFAILYYKHHYDIEVKFNELIFRLWMDMNLKNLTVDDLLKVEHNIDISTEPLMEKKYELFCKDFDPLDLEYWGQYNIDETTLTRNNVISLIRYKYLDIATNQWRVFECNEKTYAFCGTNYAKIYRPNSSYRFFWVGNKPIDYVFGWDSLPDWGNGDLVILTGGEKDALTLMSLGYYAISFNSETSDIPKNLTSNLYEIGLTVAVLYDIDKTGLTRGLELSKQLNCRNIVLSKMLLEKGGKDVSDWIRLGLPVIELRKLIDVDDSPLDDKLTPNTTLVSSETKSLTELSETGKLDLDKIEISTNAENIKVNENIFPIEIFPDSIREIIIQTNENLNFPTDFIGASIIYAISVAIGNTFKVEIKNGFRETAVVYLAIVARPGTNKSHPLHFALQPILDHDKATYKVYSQLKKEYDEAVILSKKEREEQGISEPIKPVWEKYLLSDFTPEALSEVHKNNKRSIGVYVDELAGWFKNFNRYSNGSDMEFWLSAWNSKPINIDRKKGDPIFIPSPFICVAGTIQTGLLNELAKESRTQNGFMDRILFVFPDNIKKTYWSETELSLGIIEEWKAIISKLITVPLRYDETGNPDPEILHFSPDAKKLLWEWQRMNADQCNNADSEIIAGLYSKMDMYAPRLALILEMMSWASNQSTKEKISIKSISGAIKLVEYFKKAAVKVNTIVSSDRPLEKFPKDKIQLFEALPDKFTTEEGLKIAAQLNIPDRSLKRFIMEKTLFNHLKRGEYEKRF